jgi:hypothetical protein
MMPSALAAIKRGDLDHLRLRPASAHPVGDRFGESLDLIVGRQVLVARNRVRVVDPRA